MNKITIIGIILATALSLQFNQVKGQVRLRATHVSFQNDTTSFYATNPLTVIVKNTSSQAFTGHISIYYQTDSLKMPGRAKLDSIYVVNFMSGDSIVLGQTGAFNTFIIKPNEFKTFHNIIVIWPTGSGVISEQGQGTVYVQDSIAGISETRIHENSFIIYPNPANSIINLVSTDPKYSVETVRIYNSIGSLIKVYTRNTTTLDVSSFSRGLYLLDIETNDKKRAIKRFLRE